MDALILIPAIMVVIAISVDTFIASFAYGVNGIKIPIISQLIIIGICSVMLMVSLWVGLLLRPYLPADIAKMVCFIIFLILGITKFLDGLIKAKLEKGCFKEVKFSVFKFECLLHICAKPEKADADNSKVLTPAESIYLSIALSFDGLVAGFASAAYHIPIWVMGIVSFAIGFLALKFGLVLGRNLANKLKYNISWVGGVLLILLAFLRLAL